jgi:hypothetical protein
MWMIEANQTLPLSFASFYFITPYPGHIAEEDFAHFLQL